MYKENYKDLVTKDKDSHQDDQEDYDEVGDLDVKPEIQLEEGSSDPITDPADPTNPIDPPSENN